MCGIAGILTDSSREPVSTFELEQLRDAQRHRGPDDAGIWISQNGHIGLAHRRLSIIDLSPRGHQPMSTPEGDLTITFNGEIYNHLALRQELESLGTRFRSDSDTEVILLGYRQWGAEIVHRLRGMFAFGIWDARSEELFLARDPLGIKPLYIANHEGKFAFASEVRALARAVDRGPLDVDALSQFLLWGSISSPATLYRRVRAMEPGQWLRVSRRLGTERCIYWRIEDAFQRTDTLNEADAFAHVAEALRDSVRHHLIADVPVGAFLSGGVDSVSLVALLTEIRGEPIETVTLACDDPAIDESRLAAAAARFYGTRHHEIHLDIEEIRQRMPRVVDSMDQPTVDGINTYLVSEAAREAGLKVAVSGIGGDELFGGYASFQHVPRFVRLNRRLNTIRGGAEAARLSARLAKSFSMRVGEKAARILENGSTFEGAYYASRGLFSPGEVKHLLAPTIPEGGALSDPARTIRERIELARIPAQNVVSALELRHYMQAQLLRDTDAASMAHSLEVRTPLVDQSLLCTVARIPATHRLSGPAKRALRTAPQRPVPAEFWNRRKQGFTLPFEKWLRSGRLDLPLPNHPSLDGNAVRDVFLRFKRGDTHWSRVWALMVVGQFLENT